MSERWKIRTAVALAIAGTNEFDDVFLGAWDERERPASAIRSVVVMEGTSRVQTGYDASLGGGHVYDFRVPIELSIRHDDPTIRDQEASRLANVVSNAISGVSHGGESLTEFTLVSDQTWLKAVAPERRVRLMLVAPYLIDGWQSSDISE